VQAHRATCPPAPDRSRLKGAIAFNRRLNAGLGEQELARLNRSLVHLAENVREPD
jgi:hypothetical protein